MLRSRYIGTHNGRYIGQACVAYELVRFFLMKESSGTQVCNAKQNVKSDQKHKILSVHIVG